MLNAAATSASVTMAHPDVREGHGSAAAVVGATVGVAAAVVTVAGGAEVAGVFGPQAARADPISSASAQKSMVKRRMAIPDPDRGSVLRPCAQDRRTSNGATAVPVSRP